MERAKCILCGHDAQRKSYSPSYRDDKKRVNEAGGFCYDCPNCGRCCLGDYEWTFVEFRATEDQKRELSDYSRNH